MNENLKCPSAEVGRGHPNYNITMMFGVCLRELLNHVLCTPKVKSWIILPLVTVSHIHQI